MSRALVRSLWLMAAFILIAAPGGGGGGASANGRLSGGFNRGDIDQFADWAVPAIFSFVVVGYVYMLLQRSPKASTLPYRLTQLGFLLQPGSRTLGKIEQALSETEFGDPEGRSQFLRTVYKSASLWQEADSWISVGPPSLHPFRLGKQALRNYRTVAKQAGFDLAVENKTSVFGSLKRKGRSKGPSESTDWVVLLLLTVDLAGRDSSKLSPRQVWAELSALPPDVNSHAYILYAPQNGEAISEEEARYIFERAKVQLKV